MNLSMLPSIIKSFFIIFSSIYTYGKIKNIRFRPKTCFFALLFSLFTTPIMYLIQQITPYSILAMTLFISLFCCALYKNNFFLSLCLSILVVGSCYALFATLVLITTPISLLLLTCKLPHTVSSIIALILIGLLQELLIYLLFQTKRFRDGIPEIIDAFPKNLGLFAGILVIIFSSALFIDTNLRPIYLLLFAFILALGIIIWLWWRKSIHTDYICQSYTRRIDLLEDTLREKEAEIERLSKIIHKDNKLLAALEHSARELLSDTPGDTAERLLQELNRLSEERRDTLHAYEAKQLLLAETGLFSIDTMLRYLQQRAQKYAIDFQVHFDENISSITNVINEQDLCTIVADLGENAIIATKSAEIKNILLSIEKKDSMNYTLNFFDSGEPFPEEVLAQLGKKRYTTHAATGGSGIGLMTTSELAQKYHAEFSISSTDQTPPYTKCISLTFPDTQQES